MPPTNPRKRPAPGTSSAPQMTQTYPAQAEMSNADFLRWNQGSENAGYADPAAYNMNSYGGNGLSQPQYDQPVAAPSTQLARRPINRQIVSTTHRYDNSVDPWGQFGDDSILDPQHPNDVMEENDNIELLEERAAIAKRDAQSKRKQIPPFVQKLSR
jgi:heat shock transcription factor